jgi:hypothetical protein
LRIERKQQAGLLEAFANRGHVVVEPAVRQAEPRTGGGIVEPGAPRMALAIARLDHAAGEDPGTAVVVATFGAAQLQVRLIRAVHFAWPLRKRPGAGKQFSERISVGRARNNDVVLRHESVSKFHAWIARDESDAYYVADASSRNGTSLNGASVGSKAGFDLTLSFGSAGRLESTVPEPPRYEGKRYASVRAALADGPKYFEELMTATGSDDGREIVLALEALSKYGVLEQDPDDGRYSFLNSDSA